MNFDEPMVHGFYLSVLMEKRGVPPCLSQLMMGSLDLHMMLFFADGDHGDQKVVAEEVVAARRREWREAEQDVANRLLLELKELTRLEKIPGSAPVRRDKALSRLNIADIATMILEQGARRSLPPGPKLIELLAELLEVNRHRRAFAKSVVPRAEFKRAAKIEAEASLRGQKISAHELARLASVGSHVTIISWRKSDAYKSYVEFFKRGPVCPEELYIEAALEKWGLV
jgi:hypothetical protein